MLRLTPLSLDSWPTESLRFGFAIQVSDSASRQLHVAALYRFDNCLKIGDLQSHLRTRRAEARSSNHLFWVAPDLSEEDQRILAAKIDAWLDENENMIPYSVAHPGGVVFRDNVWIGNEPGQGLTCATFIVELFNELGIPFINVETWQERIGDIEWAEWILSLLSENMPPEHIKAQKEKIGQTVRIRPSDIAAAGYVVTQEMVAPLHFDEVNPISECIENTLLGHK
ncbi:MAG: hypothetical protein HOP34_04885 [Methylococcaceae bacterium]|nr:hypothetical protein [Methylococcaceae bacterium]